MKMSRRYIFILCILLVACNQTKRQVPEKIEQPLKTGYIDVGTTNLYYEEMGQGIPLIFIHGGYLNCRMWDDQFKAFAQHYQVIRYDVRNHGKSKTQADTFSHYQDLAHLIDKLQIEKAVIVGLSMGGYIASDFALEYPERG